MFEPWLLVGCPIHVKQKKREGVHFSRWDLLSQLHFGFQERRVFVLFNASVGSAAYLLCLAFLGLHPTMA